MKHLFFRGLALSAVVLLSGLWSDAAQAAVLGTKHDLRSNGGQTIRATDTIENICVFCHTPHGGDTSVPGAPLWNRALSDTADTNGPFVMYTNRSLNPLSAPQGVSLACLSCHDGFNAINVLNNAPGSGIGSTITFQGLGVGGVMPAGITAVGRDLTNDHPISMDVPTGTGWLTPPATLSLYNSKVECATCHNPHESVNPTFLRISNAGSALCSSCHDK